MMTKKARIMDWPEDPVDALPTALWDAASVAKAIGGTTQEDCFIANVATDSREIGEGGLFFAMRGEAMDGHRFIPTAMTRGASLVVAEHPVDAPHVLVEDSFAALQALGAPPAHACCPRRASSALPARSARPA
jgi:UDP-N-acetylmuramoyl-tripeptide--D-alanyl-D-alanine ligase